LRSLLGWTHYCTKYAPQLRSLLRQALIWAVSAY
jgi:hypothetical protein